MAPNHDIHDSSKHQHCERCPPGPESSLQIVSTRVLARLLLSGTKTCCNCCQKHESSLCTTYLHGGIEGQQDTSNITYGLLHPAGISQSRTYARRAFCLPPIEWLLQARAYPCDKAYHK